MNIDAARASSHGGATLPLVSAVIKAKNEQKNLAACIESLQGLADEVIVVDDRSTDRTADIARRCGAVLVPGAPHSGVINRLDVQGFQVATGRFILRLDADERLTPELARRLRQFAEEDLVSGVRYARRYWFFGGWLDHGGWFRSQQLGFFRADSWDRNWNCDIHSQVPVSGTIISLPADVECCMLHLDYNEVSEFVSRSLLGYARIEALERLRSGHQFGLWALVRAVSRRSLGRYFLKGGYKDGPRGAVVAGLLGAYEICVAAYAWEHSRGAANDEE